MTGLIKSIWTYRFVRWALAVIFLYAGGSKLLSPQSFAITIDAYGILPDFLLFPAAIFLPLLEVIAAAGLLFDIRWSLETVTVLLLIFIAILGYGILIGLDVDCGCFAPGDPEGEVYHGLRSSLYRDFVLLAGIIYLYVFRKIQSVSAIPLPVTFFSKVERQ